MVIGDQFVWAHIPKTGGDAAHAYFAAAAAVLGIRLEIDAVTRDAKHDTFGARGVVRPHHLLTIRRLPDWCLSVLHERADGVEGEARAAILHPDRAAYLQPDQWLAQFTEGATVHRWLRTEHLCADVLDYLASIGHPLTPTARAWVAALPTKPPRDYRHDALALFGAERVEQLYRENPLWAAVERIAYPAGR